jgi:uncharacterized protein YgiM (DUF1202 family)
MNRRTHYHPATERRIVYCALWLFVACVIVIALTSCSPYLVEKIPQGTATPTITATVTAFVKFDKPSPTPAPLACIVNAGTVYLREGAGMIHAAIDVLHKGERLQVISGGDWLNVETAQRVTGWVYGRYCQ